MAQAGSGWEVAAGLGVVAAAGAGWEGAAGWGSAAAVGWGWAVVVADTMAGQILNLRMVVQEETVEDWAAELEGSGLEVGTG